MKYEYMIMGRTDEYESRKININLDIIFSDFNGTEAEIKHFREYIEAYDPYRKIETGPVTINNEFTVDLIAWLDGCIESNKANNGSLTAIGKYEALTCVKEHIESMIEVKPEEVLKTETFLCKNCGKQVVYSYGTWVHIDTASKSCRNETTAEVKEHIEYDYITCDENGKITISDEFAEAIRAKVNKSPQDSKIGICMEISAADDVQFVARGINGLACLFTIAQSGRLLASETFTNAIQKKIAESVSDELAEAIKKKIIED